MAYELDTERLRRDLEDDYGTAMSSGFPMAMMEMSEVERASDRELDENGEEIVHQQFLIVFDVSISQRGDRV